MHRVHPAEKIGFFLSYPETPPVSPDDTMKITSLLLICTVASSHAVTSASNPLDFPGGPGPDPGTIGTGLPPGPPIFPVTGENYAWTGPPSGNFFTAANWKNPSNQSPANFTSGTAQDRNFIASGVQFGNQAVHINLGIGNLSLSDSRLSLFTTFPFNGGGITGSSDSWPSNLSFVSGLSIVRASFLRNLSISSEIGSIGDVTLSANRSDHTDGTTFSGSTIDLSGVIFNVFYNDVFESGGDVTTQEVLNAYYGSITLDGVAPEFGADPLVAEPGDTMILSPGTTSRTIMIDGSSFTQTYISNYSFVPIPEPSALLLTALAIPALLRRRRA